MGSNRRRTGQFIVGAAFVFFPFLFHLFHDVDPTIKNGRRDDHFPP